MMHGQSPATQEELRRLSEQVFQRPQPGRRLAPIRDVGPVPGPPCSANWEGAFARTIGESAETPSSSAGIPLKALHFRDALRNHAAEVLWKGNGLTFGQVQFMRALPLAILATFTVLAGSLGLLGRWLSVSVSIVESPPPVTGPASAEVPEAIPYDAIRSHSPEAGQQLVAPASSEASPAQVKSAPVVSPASKEMEWTDARWKQFVKQQRAKFSNDVIHTEDHRKSFANQHRMLATQRQFHGTMQSSDLNGDLKRAQIATESRERELNHTIESLQAAALLFDQLVTVRETMPADTSRFATLLEQTAKECVAAGKSFNRANDHWVAARENEHRTFNRIWKRHEQDKSSDAIAASARSRTARSLGEEAAREAKWTATFAANHRETIRMYRGFQALKVSGQLQKVDNLAVQNQQLGHELEAMARTLFQSSRMDDSDLTRHRRKVQEITARIKSNDAEIDRAMASMTFR
jgi:hypothetical protein